MIERYVNESIRRITVDAKRDNNFSLVCKQIPDQEDSTRRYIVSFGVRI
jgi:hypothetical protein